MKKAILAAGIIAGLAYYSAAKIDYKRVPEIAGIFSSVVIHRQDYEKTLLNGIKGTKNENIAGEMLDAGYEARKRINFGKLPAEKFTKDPYDLRIEIEHSDEGDKAYLVDLTSKQKLPIYDKNQVGDLNHRLNGIKDDARGIVSLLFDEAKKEMAQAIDDFMGMLGQDERDAKL